jgi:alanine racemase
MSVEPAVKDLDEPPAAGSWIEIDASCLEANLERLRKFVAPAELCMVIKANAYGHGYTPIVPLAEAAGQRWFAVFSAREAHGFLQVSDGKSRLMVMGHAAHDNLPWVVENDLEPWINDLEDWPAIRAAAEAQERPVRVHLEIETGMHRTGLPPEDAFKVAKEIDAHPLIELEGVCTHFAGRETLDHARRMDRQEAVFTTFVDRLKEVGIVPPVRHIASTAAALMDSERRLDLVRMGIACYGLWPSEEVYQVLHERENPPTLRNVLQWKARVVALKDVADGEYVGYGTSYEAEGDTRIAVVGVGYGDGFARSLSNTGHVLIQGRRASIVGTIGMNMIQVRVGHISDVRVGDEVVLIGRQGEREISVASFSDFSSIVNYEMMARLSHEVPRRVVRSAIDDLPDPLGMEI